MPNSTSGDAMSVIRSGSFGVVALIASASCGPPREARDTTTTATSADLAIPQEFAEQRIARARCARANECDAIGIGRKYTTSDACTRLEAVAQNGAIEEKCPHGVHQEALGACLTAVRDRPCDGILAPRSSVASCRAEPLCGRN